MYHPIFIELVDIAIDRGCLTFLEQVTQDYKTCIGLKNSSVIRYKLYVQLNPVLI